MPRTSDDFSDIDPFDQRGIAQQCDAHDRQRVVDGAGHDGLALCRPGARRMADAAGHDARAQAYEQMCRDSTDAWRRGPGAQDASLAHGTEYAEGKAGDPCSVRAGGGEGYLEGGPGHLARVGGALVCVPDTSSRRVDSIADVEAVEAIKFAAWQDANRATAEAWRRGPGSL